MFGCWIIFLVSLSIAAFFGLFFVYAVSGHLGFCSDNEQHLARTLLDHFTCSRYSIWTASVICGLFVAGTAVLMAPALKIWCGAFATLIAAALVGAFLAPDMDHYAELICCVLAGGLITYILRNSNVLSAA